MLEKPFWTMARERALAKRLYIAQRKAKTNHPDFKKAFPDECRDAVNNNFTKQKARIVKEYENEIAEVDRRKAKIGRIHS